MVERSGKGRRAGGWEAQKAYGLMEVYGLDAGRFEGYIENECCF